jgi:hypothetical protein
MISIRKVYLFKMADRKKKIKDLMKIKQGLKKIRRGKIQMREEDIAIS